MREDVVKIGLLVVLLRTAHRVHDVQDVVGVIQLPEDAHVLLLLHVEAAVLAGPGAAQLLYHGHAQKRCVTLSLDSRSPEKRACTCTSCRAGSHRGALRGIGIHVPEIIAAREPRRHQQA